MFTIEKQRTTNDAGQKQIVIGHLSDPSDLNFINVDLDHDHAFFTKYS